MSEQPTIVQALSAVMNEIKAVRKEERNQSQNFNFRGIDATVNAVGPALRKHGVVVMPEVLSHDYDTVVSSSGKSMGHVIVQVTYRFYGPAGDDLACTVVGESMDMGDKAGAKAMSVAFRTALLQALCLPTDEADPDAESFERGAAKKPGKKPAKATEPDAPLASATQVSALVEAFAAVDDPAQFEAIVQQVARLNLGEADRELLGSAWTNAKKRLEGA